MIFLQQNIRKINNILYHSVKILIMSILSVLIILANFIFIQLDLFEGLRVLTTFSLITFIIIMIVQSLIKGKIIRSIYFINPIFIFGFMLNYKYEIMTKILYLDYYIARTDYDICERKAIRSEDQIHILACRVWHHKTDAVDQVIIYDATDEVGLKEGLQSSLWKINVKHLPEPDGYQYFIPFGMNKFLSYRISGHFYNVYFNLRERSML